MSWGQITLGSMVLTGLDSNGVWWDVNYPDGLTGWGSTATTVTMTQKAAADGGFPSPSFKTPRVVSVSGGFTAPTNRLAAQAKSTLEKTIASMPQLSVDEGLGFQSITFRQQDIVTPTWQNELSVDYSFQGVSADSRKFGSLTTKTTGLPSSTGGLTWPVTWPITWTGVTNSGVISIPNTGNTLAPVTLRITGPVIGPMVTHVGSGLSLVFSTSLSLGPGEYLDVDMDNRTVLAQGQQSRSGYVTSRGWFSADPGPNQYAFQAQVFSPSAQLSVTVPSGAWL